MVQARYLNYCQTTIDWHEVCAPATVLPGQVTPQQGTRRGSPNEAPPTHKVQPPSAAQQRNDSKLNNGKKGSRV